MVSKRTLRSLEVNGKAYLYKILPYFGIWEGKLRVYIAENKNGWLQVYFTFDDRERTFKNNWSPTYKWTGETGINIHDPKTVVRIIRYARNQLGWHPEENNKPTHHRKWVPAFERPRLPGFLHQ